MTTQIIQTKRQPPLWKVKSGKRIRAVFSGVSARAQAEAYAAENHGSFEVQAKQPTGRQVKRAKKMAEMAEKETVLA
jgi:hypothetical protein